MFDVQGHCSQCIDRYYLKDRSCHHVSILCGGYHKYTGECLSCNSEYFDLQDGECVQLNAIIEGCSKYEGPFCSQCKLGYYYSLYNCFKVDINCIEFDYTTNVCKECRVPLTPQGSLCIWSFENVFL